MLSCSGRVADLLRRVRLDAGDTVVSGERRLTRGRLIVVGVGFESIEIPADAADRRKP
jgi:hypothetical protein